MRRGMAEQHQFVTLNGCPTPVLVRWSYVAREPYLVTLSFRTEGGRWIEWVFARDLLIEGLVTPSGLGDVRVRPDLAPGARMLIIELESPDGFALVELRREDVEAFVARSRELVPTGTESELLDVDGFIAQVIGV